MEEEKRKEELDKRFAGKTEENQQILVLGASSHVASHIVHHFIDRVPNSHITIADTKDPSWVFQNPEMREYKGSSRLTVIQHSPFDWDWLATNQSQYNTIIVAPTLHDAKYCHNNPIDSGHRNPMHALHFMSALTKGSGWTSDGKLVILSSDKVYGPQELMPTPEDVPLHPRGVRASTRAAQELILTGLAESNGIQYMVLRLGTTYGEYTPPEKAVYSWCRSLLLGETIKMNGSFAKNDSPSRDWVHVDDVAAITASVSIWDWPTDIKNEIYNIGGCETQPHYLWNIAEAMKVRINRGTQTVMAPWREPGERGLRIWLDCKKAQEKLLFLPSVEFNAGIATRLPVWIAFHDLLWSEQQIADLKKSLGIRDANIIEPRKKNPVK